MLDVTKTLLTQFQKLLADSYVCLFQNKEDAYLSMVNDAAVKSLTAIAQCNASYHNVEHTVYVTAAGLSILEGKHSESPLTPKQWAEAVIAMLFHDIGFVRGLCKKDGVSEYSTGNGDDMVSVKRGDTDASLMPYHVDRGQCFVTENYQEYDGDLDLDLVRSSIERTRFPIPDTAEYQATDDMPGLVRAADLIGQFSDPRYINKLNALYQEFEEQGTNERIGYKTLQDMCEGYPDFFDNQVRPYIGEGVRLLQLTEVGREIIASMEKNLEIARNYTL